MTRALFFVLLACAASAAPEMSEAERDELMTVPEYKRGLRELRGHFVKRNEDPAVAARYISSLENAFPAAMGERIPVTRGVFADFLKYQAAWTRKTRDGKNPGVSAEKLAHEVERARQLKAAFKEEAEEKSPRFYQAFQAAVREVRSMRRRDGKAYEGSSAVFFSEQIDPSYTHVDAGDEALEKGDAKTAIKEANLALASNPANADAFVLRAAAEYERGNSAAAVADAQAALLLDPGNPQAQALLSLTQTPSAAKTAALDAAHAALGGDGRSRSLPADVSVTDDAPAAAASAAPTATPAVGRLLAADLSVRAVDLAATDPRGSLSQLDRAMRLDPSNASARGWHATIANRNGDYSAALGSASRAVGENPEDALGYFNKAYALAGVGDKKGMTAALEQAAKLDPVYKPALLQAQSLADAELLDHLFSDPAHLHQPAAPEPRHRAPGSLWLLGSIGAMFLSAGAVLLMRSGRGRGPAIVRR